MRVGSGDHLRQFQWGKALWESNPKCRHYDQAKMSDETLTKKFCVENSGLVWIIGHSSTTPRSILCGFRDQASRRSKLTWMRITRELTRKKRSLSRPTLLELVKGNAILTTLIPEEKVRPDRSTKASTAAFNNEQRIGRLKVISGQPSSMSSLSALSTVDCTPCTSIWLSSLESFTRVQPFYFLKASEQEGGIRANEEGVDPPTWQSSSQSQQAKEG